jgi:hypothetical protein
MELTMQQAHTAERPQNFHDERALLDHTAMVVNALRASQPGTRSPEALPRGWRDYLRTLGEAIHAYRQRREVERVAKRVDDGYLERVAMDAWAARAAGSSGFGGAEAANKDDFSSAARPAAC